MVSLDLPVPTEIAFWWLVVTLHTHVVRSTNTLWKDPDKMANYSSSCSMASSLG